MGEEGAGGEVVAEGGGFDVFLDSSRDLPGVAVRVEVLEVRGDVGEVGCYRVVVRGVGLGCAVREGAGDVADAEGWSVSAEGRRHILSCSSRSGRFLRILI